MYLAFALVSCSQDRGEVRVTELLRAPTRRSRTAWRCSSRPAVSSFIFSRVSTNVCSCICLNLANCSLSSARSASVEARVSSSNTQRLCTVTPSVRLSGVAWSGNTAKKPVCVPLRHQKLFGDLLNGAPRHALSFSRVAEVLGGFCQAHIGFLLQGFVLRRLVHLTHQHTAATGR